MVDRLMRVVCFKPHDGSHIFPTSAGDPAFTLCDVHGSRFAADEGFIRFYVAAGLFDGTAVQRHPNAMIQEPCGFLSNTEIACDFARTATVFAVHDEPQCSQPLINTER